MALVNCAECGRGMSSDALACPACGKPNTKAQHAAQNSRQAVGCAVVIASLFAAIFSFHLAAILFIVGIVLVAINTRFK